MINLLPEEEKKDSKQAYSLRLWAVILSGVVVTLIIAIPTFAPIYFSVSAKRDGFVEESKSSTALFRKTKESDLEQIVKNVNVQVGTLALGSDEMRVGEIYSKILEMKPGGVFISELSFIGAGPSRIINAKDKIDLATVTISGNSDTRSLLLAFVNNLRKDPAFSEVNLPISNLVQETNPGYSITVTVKSGVSNQ
jgi:hypothetical protein